MILAGDIGGTHTRLTFFEVAGKSLKVVVEATFNSHDYANLEAIVSQFKLDHACTITQACFGVAGPVVNGRCEATNLPWVVDTQVLAGILNLTTVGLINDLEANAQGIAVLQPADFVTLNSGTPNAVGNAALISAGTGLGEAGLYWDGQRYHPFASEGGHADFAPSNELQIELLRYLLPQFERVSWERVLAGPGLYNLYKFFRDTGRGTEPDWLAEELRHQDPPTVITQAALAGRSALCESVLEQFIWLYGAEAGNLALKMRATGGVFIGGGIAPKIIEKLKETSTFMDAFIAKGRLRSLLTAIPVQVILNDKTALLGAAFCASTQEATT
jgi:glucokinase